MTSPIRSSDPLQVIARCDLPDGSEIYCDAYVRLGHNGEPEVVEREGFEHYAPGAIEFARLRYEQVDTDARAALRADAIATYLEQTEPSDLDPPSERGGL